MICLVYFGQGPQPGEYLIFSDTGRSEFLALMCGVKSILHSKRAQIFTGVLRPKGEDRVEVVSQPLKLELSEHLARLDEIRQLVQVQEIDSERELYTPAIDSLSSIFEEVYKVRTLGKDGINLMHLVIAWIYRLRNPFICLVEAKNPAALIILAHWCISLKYMGTSWLMAGWDKHVLSGISMSLRGDYHQWIEWPVKVIHDS
ncbi:GAL4 [Aspergillus sclerotialis]|uniref:GAL4 n=1 Tax=Aspergillus sclerotialis TaxID=2070753 RepID=A0A3A2ZUG6_9EURO|nr:GAL4 [Aspergillus sclerotialis]